jgi:hypothetical protein
VERLPQAESPVQSALFAQPHAPAVHVGPPPHFEVQLEQVPPPVPHAPSSPPAAHTPALQHPPLQMVAFGPWHALPHVWELVLHACPAVVPFAAGQSVCEPHPQVSVAASHTAPPALLQTAHVPDPPHAAGSVPATQAPPEQQKPPLHVPSLPAPQADVHDPATPHVGAPAAHGVQAVPPVPHAPFVVPDVQLPALQHPPLHAVSFGPAHALPHVCVLVLQA